MSSPKKWVAVLEEKRPLSAGEFEEVKKLPEKERKEFVDHIAESPSQYFPSIESYGNDSAVIVSSSLRDRESSLRIMQFCKQKLKGPPLKDEASDFYLSIYANIVTKYDIDDPGMISMILGLLGGPGRKTHAIVVFLVVSQSKKKPAEVASAMESYLKEIVEKAPETITPAEYTSLLETLTAFYPIFPEQLKGVYTSDGCKSAFLHQVTRLTSGSGEIDPLKVAKMLQAVSSTCINEASRHFNSQNYLPFLISGTNMTGSPLVVSLSLLCVAKLWNFKQIESQISQKTVLTKSMELLKSKPTGETLSAVLETLTYLSLSGSCRAVIFKDEEVTERLVELLKSEKDASNTYGALLVFTNLTRLKGDQDDNERRRMKVAASASNAEQESTVGVSDEVVKLYNSSLIKTHKLVGIFEKLDLSKENFISECVKITHHLSECPENSLRRALVQQGALVLVLKYLNNYSFLDKKDHTTSGITTDEGKLEVRLSALRALANLSMSVDPKLAFNKYDVRTGVPFLIELFGASTSFVPVPKATATTVMAGLLSPMDKYRALLALTNLCSQPNEDLSNLVIARTFDQHLKNFMIESTNPDIQRAAWELINNLISQPAMLAKFFNTENSQSMTNLEILIKMLHAQDERLQEVIAGLLANSTMEFDLVPTVIIGQKTIFAHLRSISADILQKQFDASALMLRLGTFLGNLMEAAESEENNELKTDKQLRLGFRTVIQTTNIPEVYELFSELIQMTA